MFNRVKISLNRYSHPVAITKFNNGIIGMKNNLALSSPPISATLMETHRDTYVTAFGNYSITHSDSDKIAMEAAREVLNSDYRSNGNYVNTVANGDLAICESSGYELCKPSIPSQSKQTGASNTDVAGQIEVFYHLKIKGLISRLFQLTLTPSNEDSWKTKIVTRREKELISNLTVGQKYWIRIANVTQADIIEFEEAFSVIVT